VYNGHMDNCKICRGLYFPMRKGRCHKCNEYYRRNGVERTEKNLKRTECKNGHKYTKASVYVTGSGSKQCRICHRLREYRRRTEPEENRRSKIRHRVGHAVKAGRLDRPSLCASCGITCKTNAHHQDYGKPFEVIWLCHKCHKALHMGIQVQWTRKDEAHKEFAKLYEETT
jgi:hypothetical protein